MSAAGSQSRMTSALVGSINRLPNCPAKVSTIPMTPKAVARKHLARGSESAQGVRLRKRRKAKLTDSATRMNDHVTQTTNCGWRRPECPRRRLVRVSAALAYLICVLLHSQEPSSTISKRACERARQKHRHQDLHRHRHTRDMVFRWKEFRNHLQGLLPNAIQHGNAVHA